MKRTHVFILLALVVVILVNSGALAASSENYRIDWMVPLSGSGGGPASSADYNIQTTVGQTAIGASSSPGFSGTLGYWSRQVGESKP